MRTAEAGDGTSTYTHSGYDAVGNLLFVSLPTLKADPATLTAAEQTRQSYWDTGEIASSFDGVNPKVRFDYSAEGWQALRLPETAAGSAVSDYTRAMVWRYDADGRLRDLADLADLGGQQTGYGYDADGNQISATEGGVSGSGVTPLTVSAGYDGFDQLVEVTTPKQGSTNVLATSFAYDQHSNLAELVQNAEETSGGSQVAAGRTETFSYDDADRPLTQVDDFATTGTGDDERFSWTYTPLGLEATRTVAKANGAGWTNEQQQTSSYFANGQLETLTTTDGAGTTVEQHTLSYQDRNGIYVGSRSQDVFKLLGPDTSAPCRASTWTATWAYDGQGRLTQETTGTGTTTDYTLDVIGNITQERTNGSVTRTATYTGQQLTTDTTSGTTKNYLYDPDGNLDCITTGSWAASSCPAAGTSALLVDQIYDYRDRLAGSKTYNGAGTLTDSGAYNYDGLDRPLSETETHASTATSTSFAYIGLSNALAQETLTGGTNATRSYTYSPDGRRMTLADTSGSTTSRYSYAYNPHSSVSLLLDQTNNVNAAYAYTAYGNANTALTKTATSFNANINAYRFEARRADAGSATLDMGARRYSAPIARFLQPDVYYGSLDNLALTADPLTANRYLFAGANPITYVEADGHRPIVGPNDSVRWDFSGTTLVTYGTANGNGTTANRAVVDAATANLAGSITVRTVSVATSSAEERFATFGDGYRLLTCASGAFISICDTLVSRARRIIDDGCRRCTQWSSIPSAKRYDASRDFSSNPCDLCFSDRYEKLFNRAAYDHDVCYGSFIEARKTCDKALRDQTRAVCNGLGGWWPPTKWIDRDRCLVVSIEWSEGVVAFGGKHRRPRRSNAEPGGVPWSRTTWRPS